MVSKRGAVAFFGVLAIIIAAGIFLWMSNDLVSNGVQLSGAEPAPLYRVWKDYRLSGGTTGDHAYTASASQRNEWLKNGYSDEGIAAYVYRAERVVDAGGEIVGYRVPSGGARLYQCYNAGTKDYLYTSDKNEVDVLGKGGWNCDVIGGGVYVFVTQTAGTVPLYRVYHPSLLDHGITINLEEYQAFGYVSEGIIGYAYPSWSAVPSQPVTPTPTPEPTPTLATTTSGKNEPKGILDGADCNYIAGWTCDADDYSKSLDVHIYVDAGPGQQGIKTTIQTTADKERESAVGSACGGRRYRGFKVSVPKELLDGKEHIIYAYAIDPQNVLNPQLSGSGIKIKCAALGTAAAAVCGNGKMEEGEQCDGAKLGGKTCKNLGFKGGGILKCKDSCIYDTSACITITESLPGIIGFIDGISADCSKIVGWACDPSSSDSFYVKAKVNGLEVGAARANNVREDVKYACGGNANRGFEINLQEGKFSKGVSVEVRVLKDDIEIASLQPTSAGGNVIACDGGNVGTTTGGNVVTGGEKCGNGIIESGEVCDGIELGGKSCIDLAGPHGTYTGGTLGCKKNCQFDTSKCEYLYTPQPGTRYYVGTSLGRNSCNGCYSTSSGYCYAFECTYPNCEIPNDDNEYCAFDKQWKAQKINGKDCEFSYECKSNNCDYGWRLKFWVRFCKAS